MDDEEEEVGVVSAAHFGGASAVQCSAGGRELKDVILDRSYRRCLELPQ